MIAPWPGCGSATATVGNRKAEATRAPKRRSSNLPAPPLAGKDCPPCARFLPPSLASRPSPRTPLPPASAQPAPTWTTQPAPAVRPHQVDPSMGDLIRQERATTPGSCALGYFWRLASPQDHVCVPLATKSLAAQDNAAAGQRKVAGSDTCVQGYVWREAFPGDHVCVPPSTRAQAAADNAQTSARLFVKSDAPVPSLDLCRLLDPAGIAAHLGIAGNPVAHSGNTSNHCDIAFNDAANALLSVDLVPAASSNVAQYRGTDIPGLGDRAVLTPLMPPGSDGIRQQTLAVTRGTIVLLVSLDRQPQRGPDAFASIAAQILAALPAR